MRKFQIDLASTFQRSARGSAALLTLIGILIFSQMIIANTKETTELITSEIIKNGQAYSNLKELVSRGSRLSGSKGAEKAVAWAKEKLESYHFDKVWMQEVMVPHWERGKTEEASYTKGEKGQLRIAALGTSIGTDDAGIEGEVIEVLSLDDAAKKGDQLKGKIVFYNGPMDPTLMDTFEAYGKAVSQRVGGASQAAKFGAVAVLVRSMTLNHDHYPHTGVMKYKSETEKIPAAAVATADADRLSELLKTKKIHIRLKLSAKNFDLIKSHNVIGEIKGSEFPSEIILVGGHLDSWDLGPGAHDDGAGVVQSIEVLRAIKALNIKPKRTLRVVLFMAEEFGGSGGAEYAKQASSKNEKHIAAIESDRGGFTPRGFETNADEKTVKRIESWRTFFSPLKADLLKKGSGGSDIEPLKASGTVQFGLLPDSARYFDYHHTEIDKVDAVSSRELHLGAAAMAVLTVLLSEEGLQKPQEIP